MVVGLADELDATGVSEPAEAVDNLRGISVELLKSGTGDGERDLESTFALFYGFEKELVHRKVTLGGDPLQNGSVREIIVIMGVLSYIEEPV